MVAYDVSVNNVGGEGNWETARQEGAGKSIDVASDGRLFALGEPESYDSLHLFWSSDGGQTWTDWGYVLGSMEGYSGDESIHIDSDDNIHIIGWTANDRPRYDLLTYDAGTGTITSRVDAFFLETATSNVQGVDVVGHPSVTDGKIYAHCQWGSATSSTKYQRLVIDPAGPWSCAKDGAEIVLKSGQPSEDMQNIEFNHNGDGRTVQGSSPDVWALTSAYSAHEVEITPLEWNGSGWTQQAKWLVVDLAEPRRPIMRFDGTRLVVGLYKTGSPEAFDIYDVNVSTGASTLLTSAPATISGNTIAMAVDHTNGNIHLVQGQTSGELLHVMYDRGGGTWGTWQTVTADNAAVGTYPSGSMVQVRAHVPNGRSYIDAVWVPSNDATHDEIRFEAIVSLNTAPNAPTLVAPADGGEEYLRDAILLDWTFNDPDAGDTQSAADVQVRPVGGANVIDTSVGTATQYTIPASTLTEVGTYEWRVRTYDSASAQGPWSSYATFDGKAHRKWGVVHI